MISEYLHHIDYKDNYKIIFNSLLNVFLLVDRKLYEDIINQKDISGSILNILYEYGIYSYKETDEKRYRRILDEFSRRDNIIDTVYIIPTLNCNLKCRYCHVYNKDKLSNFNNKVNTNIDMDKYVADVIVDKYIQYYKINSLEKAFIQFYGGEPTLNWEIIERMVRRLKQSRDDIDISIVTNGTVDLKNRMTFLKENEVGLGISVDGPEIINNINRVSKKNYYDIINKNIMNLKQNNIRYAISFTITEEVIKNKEVVMDWIKKIDVNNINTNLLQLSKWSEEHKRKYIKDAMDLMIDISEAKISNDRINRKIKAFTSDNFYYSDCSAGIGNQITIRPDGKICICQGEFLDDDMIIGDILDDDLSDIEKNIKISNKFIDNIPIYNEKCKYCECIRICGGGCDSKRSNVNNDIIACEYNKKILNWMLFTLLDNIDIKADKSIYIIK